MPVGEQGRAQDVNCEVDDAQLHEAYRTLATPERLPYQAMWIFAPGSYPDRISHGWTVKGQKVTPHFPHARSTAEEIDARATKLHPVESIPSKLCTSTRKKPGMLNGEIVRGIAAFPTLGPFMGDATPDFCDSLSGRQLPPPCFLSSRPLHE